MASASSTRSCAACARRRRRPHFRAGPPASARCSRTASCRTASRCGSTGRRRFCCGRACRCTGCQATRSSGARSKVGRPWKGKYIGWGHGGGEREDRAGCRGRACRCTGCPATRSSGAQSNVRHVVDERIVGGVERGDGQGHAAARVTEQSWSWSGTVRRLHG
eukprot:356479-Chlamydomonas_euryale.AAC.2